MKIRINFRKDGQNRFIYYRKEGIAPLDLITADVMVNPGSPESAINSSVEIYINDESVNPSIQDFISILNNAITELHGRSTFGEIR